MTLKMIVLVKQVPDTKNITGEAMLPDGTVNRGALPAITNPEDLHALEAALEIKDEIGGSVTVISLGPPTAVKALKECLYRGADDVILVTDMKFAASDTLATSYALKCAIEKIGTYDIIFCGRQAIDGDTAQVGPQIAEKLGINQITCVSEFIAFSKKDITLRRAIDGGVEVVKSKFPLLITVTDEANEPRSPSAKRTLRYKNITCKCSESYNEAYIHANDAQPLKHIKQWTAEDIKADPKYCGLSGSPTKVKQIQSVVLAAKDTKAIPNTAADVKGLVQELINEHIIG